MLCSDQSGRWAGNIIGPQCNCSPPLGPIDCLSVRRKETILALGALCILDRAPFPWLRLRGRVGDAADYSLIQLRSKWVVWYTSLNCMRTNDLTFSSYSLPHWRWKQKVTPPVLSTVKSHTVQYSLNRISSGTQSLYKRQILSLSSPLGLLSLLINLHPTRR